MLTTRLGSLSVALCLLCLGSAYPMIAQAADLSVYMSTTGNDENNGLSNTAPVKTIGRAQAVISSQAPTGNVTVLLENGIYRQDYVTWSFKPLSGKRVTFKPRVWNGIDRPTFHACAANGTACVVRSFFRLDATGSTNVTFEHLRFERYTSVLDFRGDSGNPGAFNSGNKVLYCYFYQIGEYWYPELGPATFVVRLQNSRDNEIAYNWFVSVRNSATGGPEFIHPLYIAHFSSNNAIHHNQFNISSGDAIRIRNESNFNHVYSNNASGAGEHALVNAWFSRAEGECPSWGTDIEYNTNDGLYSCTGQLYFHYDYGLDDNGCTGPAEVPRFTSRSNVQDPQPYCDLL